MDILKFLLSIAFILILSSCAKIGYLYEQGIGQAKLIIDARDNQEVLKDQSVSDEMKDKIKKIQTYKKFFYQYWHLPETEIYNETNILDRDAVTYLVIASTRREIKPLSNCFFLAGCFPYLGFFELKSAKKHVKTLNEKGYDTYLRSVLAYSTLGNLDDPILSTFFKYSKYDLAETIFHELFHTILFIKGEVDLNENLANYFGKEMLKKFFKEESEKLEAHFKRLELNHEIKQEIVDSAQELKEILKESNWKAQKKHFLEVTFPQKMKNKCEKLGLKKCWPLSLTWNNATFSAFMTYEKSQDKISALAGKFNGDLRAFFLFIQSEYDKYVEEDIEVSFEDYLLK
ncbi:MAG: hypothetical protein CME69_03695 [Halobacteriovorax sp.]|nr:hypothetical protein [Halobacteriovorax sp.]